MNAPMPVAQTAIVEQIRRQVTSGLRGAALIDQLNGLHPIEVKSTLIDANELPLLASALSGLSIAAGTVIHEIAREDNPALSFWPFAPQTTYELANLIDNHSTVALLGVPSLFKILNSRRPSNSISACLFDADTYFVPERTEGFCRCDISELPDSYYGKFDAVVADPPWYIEEYRRWLGVASRLCKAGGTLYFVLFSEGVRPAAPQERRRVLDLANCYFADVTTLPMKVRYQTPSFEQVQMLRHGIQPVDWRTAELIQAQSPRRGIEIEREPRAVTVAWREHRVGSGRVFIRRGIQEQRPSHWLETAEKGSRFLNSPSRRSAAATRCNVLSSRGHGLVCAEPDQLSSILATIHDYSDVRCLIREIPETSRSVFEKFIHDLWGRYILL